MTTGQFAGWKIVLTVTWHGLEQSEVILNIEYKIRISHHAVEIRNFKSHMSAI
jgi:hypothetical protein